MEIPDSENLLLDMGVTPSANYRPIHASLLNFDRHIEF